MKQAIFALVVAAGVVGGWYWYTRPQPVVAPTHRLAPPGVYFLVQRVSLTTDAGVLSFAEGTRVQAVAEKGDRLHVRADEREFDVDRAKVTNDLDIAAAVAQRDAGSRKRFEAWARQQQAAVVQHRQVEAAEIERAEAARRAIKLPPMGFYA